MSTGALSALRKLGANSEHSPFCLLSCLEFLAGPNSHCDAFAIGVLCLADTLCSYWHHCPLRVEHFGRFEPVFLVKRGVSIIYRVVERKFNLLLSDDCREVAHFYTTGAAVTAKKQDLDILLAAGLPLSGDHEEIAHEVDFAEVARAALALLKAGGDERIRDAMKGWLLALYLHYPTLYQTYFKDALFACGSLEKVDGRLIKLRRIALARLARVA